MRYPPKHDLYEPISNAAYGFLVDPPPLTFPLPLRKMAKFIVPPCKTPHDERFKVRGSLFNLLDHIPPQRALSSAATYSGNELI
ncbi:hypothetical protein TNCT_205021 [Trichonephila clavata]|uniref:Uncharacterized protein n=1 Tax=Trichonephila clavata TaxID=2740835 RepID=A0A8X6FVL1_TRICU|nr:hypothetical protein TNCT_205021 [Trichonephila clavata]